MRRYPAIQPKKAAAGSTSTLLNGLVAYWQFDYGGTVGSVLGRDAQGLYSAGAFLHGSSVPTATGGVSTSLASGIHLSTAANGGTGQWLASPSGATSWAQNFLAPAGTSFTVCGWINQDINTQNQEIFALGIAAVGSAGGLAWELVRQNSGSRYKMQLYGDANETDLPAAATATNTASGVGAWHFVMGWVDGVAGKVYCQLDNGTVVTGSATTGCFQTIGPLALGASMASNGTASGRCNAFITGLGYWNRVLTAQERTNLFNSGAGISYPFTGF